MDVPVQLIIQRQGNLKAKGSPGWSSVSRNGDRFYDETLRIMDDAASTIQSAWRRYNIKKLICSGCDFIEEPANWEIYKNRRRKGLIKTDADLIQAKFQGFKALQDWQISASFPHPVQNKGNQVQHDAAVTIQSYYRGYRTRMGLLFLNHAATVIQAHYRGYRIRKAFRNIKKEATITQLGWGAHQGTKNPSYPRPTSKPTLFLSQDEHPFLLFMPCSPNASAYSSKPCCLQRHTVCLRPPSLREDKNEACGMPQCKRPGETDQVRVGIVKCWDQCPPPRRKECRILEGIGMGPVYRQYPPCPKLPPQGPAKKVDIPKPLNQSARQLFCMYPTVSKPQPCKDRASGKKIIAERLTISAMPVTNQSSQRKNFAYSDCSKDKLCRIREIIQAGEQDGQGECNEQPKLSKTRNDILLLKTESLASYVPQRGQVDVPRVGPYLVQEEHNICQNPRQDAANYFTWEKPTNRYTVNFTRDPYAEPSINQWLNDSPEAAFEQCGRPIQDTQRKNKATASVFQEAVKSISVCQSTEPYERRVFKTRTCYQLENGAAITIQAAWRGYLARLALKGRHDAATKLQAMFRGYIVRKDLVDSGVLDSEGWQAKQMRYENKGPDVVMEAWKYTDRIFQPKGPRSTDSMSQRATYSLIFRTSGNDGTRT
ncbi:uncharacterized protein LOC115098053 [Rhinatrema bivittatum]|uniref:uncharacterized protein LOC115098053 n=1 Tax=Rhinatrema bivittatum TaxID=194408 RepID=UPI00112B0EA0|nr:uncharacterized protein LOC115098053 [Rhinatrema bivittatum]XP_029470211.1 uncharacterized protein LOC115098053 [Rhinatrema bivittatum]XP_029470212.1 uncharacterized protein LOC115098053 [Rhinatrema bivittatum]